MLDRKFYDETLLGAICRDEGMEDITTEADCETAAKGLGHTYGFAWDGPNDFPACVHANDGRDTVYFNKSKYPRRRNVNRKYSGICNVVPGTQINIKGRLYRSTI